MLQSKPLKKLLYLGKLSLLLKLEPPTPSKYHPELDESLECNDSDIRFCQEMVGILRWVVELGRVEILLEVSLTSSYITCPYIGHMKALIHMFAFLKSKPKLTIAFDPRHPFTEESRFVKCDWSNIYPDAQEDIPSDLPPPLEKDDTSTCFVDASHGSNLKNRRS